jgi:VanZ family protein
MMCGRLKENDREVSLLKKTVIVIIILTLALIWGQSVLSREQSSKESSWVYERFEAFMRFIVGPELATEILLRKVAHFSEFFLLSAEAMILCILLGKKTPGGITAVFLLSNFCALLDETIQIFSGRGSLVSDVWIDTAGAVSGMLFVLFVSAVIESLKEERMSRRNADIT